MKKFILYLLVISYNITIALGIKEKENYNEKNYIEDEEFVYLNVDDVKKIEDNKKEKITKMKVKYSNNVEEENIKINIHKTENQNKNTKNSFENYPSLEVSLNDIIDISKKLKLDKTNIPLLWEYFLSLNTKSFLETLNIRDIDQKLVSNKNEFEKNNFKDKNTKNRNVRDDQDDNEDNIRKKDTSTIKNFLKSHYSKFLLILLTKNSFMIVLLHIFSFSMYLIPYRFMVYPKFNMLVLTTFLLLNFLVMDFFYTNKYYFFCFVSYYYFILNIEKLWSCLFTIENIWEIEENYLNQNSLFDAFNFDTTEKFIRKAILSILILFLSIYLTFTKYRSFYFYIFQFYIYRLIRFIFIRYFKYNNLTPCEMQPFENFIDIVIGGFTLILSNFYYFSNYAESEELLGLLIIYNTISFYFIYSLDKFLYIYRNGLSDFYFEYSLYTEKSLNCENDKDENENNKNNKENNKDNNPTNNESNNPNESVNKSISESNCEIINNNTKNISENNNINQNNYNNNPDSKKSKENKNTEKTNTTQNKKTKNKTSSKNSYKKNKKKEKEIYREEIYNNPNNMNDQNQKNTEESSDDEILTLENLRKFESFQELVDKINLKRYYRIDIFNFGNIIDVVLITLITMILIFSFYVDSIFLLFLAIYLINIFFRNNAIYISTKHSRLISNIFQFILMLLIYNINFHNFEHLNQITLKGVEIHNYKIVLKILLKFFLFCFTFKSLFLNYDFLSFFNIYYYSSYKYIQQEGINMKKINQNSELMFRIKEVYNFKACLYEIFCFNLEKSKNYLNYIFENCKFLGKKSDFSILEYSLDKNSKNYNIILLIIDYFSLYFCYWLTYFVFKDNNNFFYYIIFSLFKIALIIKIFFIIFEYSKSVQQRYFMFILNTIFLSRLISFFDEFYLDYFLLNMLIFLNKAIYIYFWTNSVIVNILLIFLELLAYRKFNNLSYFLFLFSLIVSKSIFIFNLRISKRIQGIVFFSVFVLISSYLIMQVNSYLYSITEILKDRIINTFKVDLIGVFEYLYYNCDTIQNYKTIKNDENLLLDMIPIRECRNTEFIEAYMIKELLKNLIHLKLF